MCLVWVLMLTGLIKFLCPYVNMLLTSANTREADEPACCSSIKSCKEPRTRSSPRLPAHVFTAEETSPIQHLFLSVFLAVTLSSLCNAFASSVLICSSSCYRCDSLGHEAQTKYFHRKHVRRLKELRPAFRIKERRLWVGSVQQSRCIQSRENGFGYLP